MCRITESAIACHPRNRCAAQRGVHDLPFKAIAWADSQGKVWLSYTNGSYTDKKYSVKGAAKYVANIDETIEKIMTEALK